MVALFASILVSDFAFSEELVKVRLRRGVKSLDISGHNIYINKQAVSSSPNYIGIQELKFSYDVLSKTWVVGNKKNKRQLYYKESYLDLRGESLRVNLHSSPNHLKLHKVGEGLIDLVAELDMDYYLSGVIPAEMPTSWPIEAIKAQVVASRSYTENTLKYADKAPHFNMESNVFDQVYKFHDHRGVKSNLKKKVKQAIEATAHEVLANDKNIVVRAFYHADCGGQTEHPKYVWSRKTSFGTVKDLNCPASPNGQWLKTIPISQVNEKLSRHLGVNSSLSSLSVIERSPSGRATRLLASFSNSVLRTFDAQSFRRLFGFNSVKSTMFDFRWGDTRLEVKGRGHGHGVGLCQWGTKKLAQKGLSYKQILKHYYPQAKLFKLEEKKPQVY